MEWIGFRPLSSTYKYLKTSAASTWTVKHNLDKHPSVTVVDSGGTVVKGDITYNSANQLTITFSSSFSGTAYLN
jgi:hypothetical protein